ncbi:ABC transporter substrate-binding protein [Lonepinella sp. BR2271]|uniref:ABC transporter substrate-binding protein n=1 Tax=Lonepinella sp. BR2271 TaxID=3434550 RepID=UPI003F6DF7B9
MQHKLLPSLLAGAVALAFAFSAHAAKVPEGTELADVQEIVINNGSEPQSLDPHLVDGVPESQILSQLFEGLANTDPEGKIEPGVAESWEHSEDYKTWTFHLRKDAKWSNGDPVTAQDFVYAWQRLATPATASPYASFLTYMQVVNAQDVIDGKKAPSELGVKAVDDYTFEVTLDNAVPYAVEFTTHQSLLPVPKNVVEKLGNSWVKTENIVTNGAYLLKEHVINEKIVMERNKDYWDDKSTVINKATFLMIENPTTDVQRYRAGDLHVTSYALPTEQFAKLKKEMPDEVFVTKTLATYFYEINNNKPPFNDVRVRKALNLALDRNIITDKVMGQGQTPTYVFTPPYIHEGEKIKQPAYSTQPMAERNAEAVKLLEEAGFSKANPLKFNILYNTNENHKKVAIAAASIWKANTQGVIDVKLENKEWKTYAESRHAGNYDVARAGWTGDYNHATTFLNNYLSNSSNNSAFYKSAAFDEVILQSRKELDAGKRAEDYAKAEQILVEDAVLIPVYTYVNPRMVKPFVKGYSGKDPQDKILVKNFYIIKH